jgi:uncharacterized protein
MILVHHFFKEERYMKNTGKKLIYLAVFITFGLVCFSIFVKFYTDFVWFESLNFESVFWTSVNTEYLIWLSSFFVFILFIYLNYRIARTAKPISNYLTDLMNIINKIKSPVIFVNVVVIIIGFIMAGVASSNWMNILSFINKESFGVSDPIFDKDISFYVFNLPLYSDIKSWLLGMLIITFLLVLLIYFYKQAVAFEYKKLVISKQAQIHIAILLIAIFALEIFGFWLKSYYLLFSTRSSIFYGATYTDINAQLTSYRIMMVVLGISAALLIYSIISKKMKYIIYTIVLYFSSWLLFGAIYPAVIQSFVVKPNEQSKELPYIENNIKFTRSAFRLDKIEEKNFEVKDDLNLESLRNNKLTVDNIMLWDYRPLLATYKQLQVIRSYYNFNDLDIDRYTINGRYQQVMVSPREIDLDKLPADVQTWVNKELIYTHGYGVVMSPVTQVTDEGLPNLYLKDIPPQSHSDIKLTRPEVYFGEMTTKPVIVNGNIEEFDYPVGDSNKYTKFQGNTGVGIGSFFRRVIFAWKYSDFSYLVTSYISPESKILYHRNILERAKKIAPFLTFEKDPYAVIADGKLYWGLDAYTTSENYPYSTMSEGGFNYIRNSVKITIDAYNGEVKFYSFKPQDDPIIRVYQKIFPGLFRPFEEMPKSLKEHMRYPQDLFDIQSKMYETYHMTDGQVYYNKEDLWTVANEKYSGKVSPMESYYVIMKLPESQREEFMLMVPYTPSKRDNMIAWFSARCDGDDYGKLLVYKFPKKELLYGPMQVSARIDQDAKISQELTLWNQQGSQVSRGNLLVIPINNSFLYVQPLYLSATEGQMPELKRVIVAYSNRIAMESSFDLALQKVFGGTVLTSAQEVKKEVPNMDIPVKTVNISDLAKQALDYYNKAEGSVKSGNWANYGDNLSELKKILEKMVSESSKNK